MSLDSIKYQPKGHLQTLERFEVAFALMVARKRTFENRHKRHIYKRLHNLEPQPVGEMFGVCCEMAVAKYLDRYWASLAWETEEHNTYRDTVADVGTDNKIEVRRIRNIDNPLTFWPKDLKGEKVIYLTYCLGINITKPQTTYVDIIGFTNIAESFRYSTKQSDGSFTLPQHFLDKVTGKKLYTAKPF